MNWVQSMVGAALAVFGFAIAIHGVSRYRRAASASTEPLESLWEHWLNFGLMPREFGSRRRVERIAGAGELLGGLLAVVAGSAIFAVGIGG